MLIEPTVSISNPLRIKVTDDNLYPMAEKIVEVLRDKEYMLADWVVRDLVVHLNHELVKNELTPTKFKYFFHDVKFEVSVAFGFALNRTPYEITVIEL